MNNKYLIIISLCFIILLNTFFNSYKHNLHENLTSSSNDTEECPMPLELTCKEGPIGPPGLPGGIFQKQGPLRNLGYNNIVMDRLAGTGPASVPYLSDMNYTSHQTWTFENDLLKNEYGNCLYGDDKTNLVYMNDCTGNTGNKWINDNLGRLLLKNNPKKCLTPNYEGVMKDLKNNINLNPKQSNSTNKFIQVKLNDCDTTINQKWAFY